MPTKDDIKAKLCIDTTVPNFPLGPFVEWVELQYNREILRHLEQIQQELSAEERAWRDAAPFGKVTGDLERASRWSLYCAQAKAYYTAITHDPANKEVLGFLLRAKHMAPPEH